MKAFELQSTKLKNLTSESAEHNHKNDALPDKAPEHLVSSLDLIPLMQNVVKHAGTKRARDALMGIVDHPKVKKEKFLNANYNKSRRKAILSNIAGSSFATSNIEYISNYNTRHIVKVADSLSEAQNEWALIEEATRLLKGHGPWKSFEKKSAHSVPLPPIYAKNSSPWSMSNLDTDTDDDEWLQSIAAGYRGTFELEQILQADMILRRIVESYEWAKTQDVIQRAPNLSGIFKGVDIDLLKEVQNEMKGTVMIVKGVKSISDPTGTKVSVKFLECKYAA